MPRLQRLTDFIARLLGKEWDVRALDHQRSSRPSSPVSGRPGDSRDQQEEPPTVSPYFAGPLEPADSADSTDLTDSGAPSGPAQSTASSQASDASHTWLSGSGRLDEGSAGGGEGADRTSELESTDETTQALTLARIKSMLTGPMEYSVQLTDDREHPCLLGTWDSFPFVIEIPEGHDGWLLVSGDWEEAAPASQRDEIAASVNDWNRDKFFPNRRRRRHPHRAAGASHLPHRPVRRGDRQPAAPPPGHGPVGLHPGPQPRGPLLPEI